MIKRSGFTLVEILIVVVILGILSVIVIPMFAGASLEAQTSALNNNLRKVRGQIELYKFHHTDQLPASAGDSSDDFARRMISQTDNNGGVGTDYGPYLNQIPVNPFNGRNTVRIDDAAAGANTDGWRFNTTSGIFQADDSAENAAY